MPSGGSDQDFLRDTATENMCKIRKLILLSSICIYSALAIPGYALWTAKKSSVTDILSLTVTLDICVSSHNKTNYKRYQHVINNAITISNFLLSYDNYSDNNIHFSWSTILIFKLSSTLETESLKVETTSNLFSLSWI